MNKRKTTSAEKKEMRDWITRMRIDRTDPDHCTFEAIVENLAGAKESEFPGDVAFGIRRLKEYVDTTRSMLEDKTAPMIPQLAVNQGIRIGCMWVALLSKIGLPSGDGRMQGEGELPEWKWIRQEWKNGTATPKKEIISRALERFESETGKRAHAHSTFSSHFKKMVTDRLSTLNG